MLSFPNDFRRKLVLFLTAVALSGLAGCGSNPQRYVDRGKKYFDAGKLEDAAIQYKKALQKAPRLAEAHYRLALVLMKQNQPGAAFHELQGALAAAPADRDINASMGHVSLALYHADPQHSKQLYDVSVKCVEQLLRANPSDYDGNLLKGALSLDEKKPGEAIQSLRKATAVKPGELSAKLGLAEALVQDGQAQAGVDLARGLVAQDKKYGPAYDFLYSRYIASGNQGEAEAVLKLKAANNPKEAGPLLELARYYSAAKKPAEMATTIQQLVDRSADFPEGRREAGDFYALVGQPDEALKQYEQGLAHAKDPSIYRKRMVRVQVAQRKWPAALEQLEVILKAKPDDGEAKLVRALVWLDEGKPEHLDAAIAELRTQSASRPTDTTLHFQLGNALLRKRDAEGARREWKAAAQRNRYYMPPRLALMQVDLSQGRAQEALTVSEEVLANTPNDPQARLMHATCLTGAGRYPEARAELTGLATRYPQVRQVKFRLGVLALSEKKFKEAEQIMSQLNASGPDDPQVKLALAQAYSAQNEPAKGMALLQDEVRRNPDAFAVRQMLANFAMQTGKYDVAVEQYGQMQQMAPTSRDAQLGMANALMARGDSAGAITILQKVATAEPGNVNLGLQVAQALAGAGRLGEAKAKYRSLLAADPNNANALNDLAFLMAESGDSLDQALSMAQKSEQNAVAPDLKLSASDTLGWIYLKKKMDDNALQTFQVLVRKSPGNATFRYHLGAALLRKGDREKARVELQAALSARPGSSDAPKIRELLNQL